MKEFIKRTKLVYIRAFMYTKENKQKFADSLTLEETTLNEVEKCVNELIEKNGLSVKSLQTCYLHIREYKNNKFTKTRQVRAYNVKPAEFIKMFKNAYL